jgi:hypothetical protein
MCASLLARDLIYREDVKIVSKYRRISPGHTHTLALYPRKGHVVDRTRFGFYGADGGPGAGLGATWL